YIDPNATRYANLNDKERKALEALGDSINHLSAEEIQEAVSEFLETKKRQTKENSVTENNKKAVNPRSILESWTGDHLSSIGNKNDNNRTSPYGESLKDVNFWKGEEENEEGTFENPGGFVSTTIVGNSYKEDQ